MPADFRNCLFASLPPGREPELYYALAARWEKEGRLDRAREVLTRLQAEKAGHRDAGEKLSRLEALSAEDQGRLTRFSAVSARLGSGKPLEGGKTEFPEEVIGRLGHYELLKPLGRGGMGFVYKARDPRLRRLVAVKKMLDQERVTPDEKEQFREEALLVADMRHPYIVAIHDLLEEDGHLYLVFEYIDGATIQDSILQKGKLSPKECVRILKFTVQALHYAHEERAIIHRDLKPANIMRDRRGYVKVMDFGIARKATGQTQFQGFGPAVGTACYMAPEQHRGQSERRSDIFCLGASAYEMLTARLPFPGPDYLAQKDRGRFQPLPDDVPSPLRALVSDCLAADPDKRPADMAALLRRLETA